MSGPSSGSPAKERRTDAFAIIKFLVDKPNAALYCLLEN